jgi:hypothetical protein
MIQRRTGGRIINIASVTGSRSGSGSLTKGNSIRIVIHMMMADQDRSFGKRLFLSSCFPVRFIFFTLVQNNE